MRLLCKRTTSFEHTDARIGFHSPVLVQGSLERSVVVR